MKNDQIGKLTGYYVVKDYPEKLHRVKFYDKETDRQFAFLSNNFELSAKEFAFLYKNRWQVELFFKWIKQHLKIKAFWGNFRKRCPHPEVFSHHCILSCCNSGIQSEYRTINLRNSTGFR